jgi:AAA15 family ATPase/GTPase
MKIKKLELTNFKRFDHLVIDLGDIPKKVIALVGPNGAGKSSVFDAFEEKVKDVRGGSLQSSYLLKSLYKGDYDGAAYNRHEQVKVGIVDNKPVDRKSFYVRTPYRFTPRINVQSISTLPDTLEDNEMPQSSVDLDQRLQKNYQRLIGRFFTEVYNKDQSGKEWVEKNTQKINDVLIKVLDIEISNLGDVTSGKGQFYFHKGNSKDFPYENLSSGEKEVVDIIVDLLIKSYDYNDTVWCIDEPELHLSTAIQKTLLIEIEKLIPEDSQLWIATHSVGFLRALQEELSDKASIIDFSDRDFDSSVEIVPMKKTRRNWKRIFKTALEDITGLLAPRKIIYCEGRKESDENGQEQGIDATVYNLLFESDFPDVLFISSGGETQPVDYSEIALRVLEKAFDEVEIFVLKDRDENTENERNVWMSQGNNRLMLKRRELENYILDFQVLKRIYPDVSEDAYKSIVVDIITDNVKDKIGNIMVMCGVLSGINKSEFLLNLAGGITNDMDVYTELKEIIFS